MCERVTYTKMQNYVRGKKIGEGAYGKALLCRRKDDSKQYVIKEINITKVDFYCFI